MKFSIDGILSIGEEIEGLFFIEEVPIKIKVKPLNVNNFKNIIEWGITDNKYSKSNILNFTDEFYCHLRKNDRAYFFPILYKEIDFFITEFPRAKSEIIMRNSVRVKTSIANPVVLTVIDGNLFPLNKGERKEKAYVVNDISITGFSFISSLSEAKNFDVGKIYAGILHILNEPVSASFKVVRKTSLSDDTVLIGAELYSVDLFTNQILNKYIVKRQREIARRLKQ